MTNVNIFSVHYFLWFSALTAIYGYGSVYAEHYANASSSQYGLLNMVLPFVTILAKVFFCSLADRHRAYRTFFISFLVIALVGWGSYGILPFFIHLTPKNQGLNHGVWVLICIMTSVATISTGVTSCLSDAFAMNFSKKTNISYGAIRLWGTVGWGVSSLLLASINQADNLPLLVPGLLMTIALLVVDIFAQLLWPHKDDYELDKSASNVVTEDVVLALNRLHRPNPDHATKLTSSVDPTEHNNYGATVATTADLEQGQISQVSDMKIQWLLFKEVSSMRRSIFRYMILFIVSGALISMQWSYFFLFLNNIYTADFAFISGLSMFGQSMIGELPFFMVSNEIVKILGRSHTLSVSIISIGIRYLLYAYLLPNSSMYFVLLTESLQGPSFGLFYVVMTEVGLDYSDCETAIVNMAERGVVENSPTEIQKLRMALRVTMQSLMSACYEGLGLGIGSIVGGVIIERYGFTNLWTWTAIASILIGSLNLVIELLKLPILVDRQSNVFKPIGSV